MKSKKAELLEGETMKIILAVICIVFLVILAVQLYGLFANKTRIEQAKATTKEISGVINDLMNSNFVSKQYIILAPKGWFFTGWSKGENSATECQGEACI